VPGSPSRKSFAETPEAEQLIDLKKQGDQMSFFEKNSPKCSPTHFCQN
jgi:hypothetical protein